MGNHPYIGNNHLIDDNLNKPYELIHQRFFNNISIASGWRKSIDGFFNYYLDIKLEVEEGEFPITLAYSPSVMIPNSANPSCMPSNFPYARTIAENTVRLYSYRVPDPEDMSLITITLKAVNTSHGTTNGNYGKPEGVLNFDQTTIQVKGETFTTEIDKDRRIKEETALEVNVSGFKGTEKRKVRFGKKVEHLNQELPEEEKEVLRFEEMKKHENKIFRDMSGEQISLVNLDANNNEIEVMLYREGTEESDNLSIILPKGLKLKDKMAYFILPVLMDGQAFEIRITLYTDKSFSTIDKNDRYHVEIPTITRSSGNKYYANGELISAAEGFEIKATKTNHNGITTMPAGRLSIFGMSSSDFKEYELGVYTVQAGSPLKLVDTSIFNGHYSFRVVFFSDGKDRYEARNSIEISKRDIVISSNIEYMMSTILGEEHILPELQVNTFSISNQGFYDPYYGLIIFYDQNKKVLGNSYKIETNEFGERTKVDSTNKSALLNSMSKPSGELPNSITVAVYDASDVSEFVSDKEAFNKEPLVSKTFTVIGESVPTGDFVMELTPGSITINMDENNNMEYPEYSFDVSIFQGGVDVSDSWTSSLLEDINPSEIEIEQGTGAGKHNYTITSFNSYSVIKVLTIKATNGTHNLMRNIAINKNVSLSNIFSIRGPNLIESYQEEGTSSLTISGNPQIFTAITNALEEDLSKWIYNWQYQNVNTGAWTNFFAAGTDEFLNQTKELRINLDPSYFGVDRNFAIRAEIEIAMDNGQIRKYTPTKTLNLIRTDAMEYLATYKAINSTNEQNHVFEVDRYNNAVSGTLETTNPVEIQALVYKGNKKLNYIPFEEWETLENKEGFYTLESYNTRGCSVFLTERQDSEVVENELLEYNDLVIYFSRIEATAGDLRLNILIEATGESQLRFDWSTTRVGQFLTREVEIRLENNPFTLDSVPYQDIINFEEVAANYTQAFVDNNEPIRVYLTPNNTSVKGITFIKNAVFKDSAAADGVEEVRTDLDADLIYNNGTTDRIIPLNILSTLDRNTLKQEGDVMSGAYYLLSVYKKNGTAVELADVLNQEYSLLANGDLVDEFKIKKNALFDFNGNKTILIKIPPRVERISAKSNNLEIGSELIWLDPNNQIKSAFREMVDVNKFTQGNLIQLEVSFIDDLYLPREYDSKINNSFRYRKGSSWREQDYLEISPNIAVMLNYFNNFEANTSAILRVESATGERTLVNIDRVITPFRKLDELSQSFDKVLTGNILNAAEIALLSNSRQTILNEKEEIESIVEGDDGLGTFIVPVPDESPSEIIPTVYYSKDENGIHSLKINLKENRSVPKKINEDGSVESLLSEINLNSILGINMFDNTWHHIKFKLYYETEDPMIELLNASISLSKVAGRKDSLEVEESEAIFGLQRETWTTISLLIPPSNFDFSIDGNDGDSVLDYLIKYNILTEQEITDTFVYFRDKPRSKNLNSFGAYYVYLNTDKDIPEPILMKELEVSELHLGYNKEVSTYKTIINDFGTDHQGLYSNFKEQVDTYFRYIDLILNEEALGRLPVELRNLIINSSIDSKVITPRAMDVKDLKTSFEEVKEKILEVKRLIEWYSNLDSENAIFKAELRNRSYTMGISTSSGWLSSIQISPNGVLVQGEKNVIVGSTSIGTMYGKKIVIGKEITQADIEYDNLYTYGDFQNKDQPLPDGVLAVWDSSLNSGKGVESGAWASVMNKRGQYFYRYEDPNNENNNFGMVGYMVMNAKEIAAYQFNKITDGLNTPNPFDVETSLMGPEDKYSVFKIDHQGRVVVNNLAVEQSVEDKVVEATVDLMRSIRIQKFDSHDGIKRRRGIVFVGIDGGVD